MISYASLFIEENWLKMLPKRLLIPSLTVELDEKDLELVLNDDTNPKIKQLRCLRKIEEAMFALGGEVIIKVGGRTAKDLPQRKRRVKSALQLVMIIKMSEYLSEALDEEQAPSTVVLRKYLSYLADGECQYRVYYTHGKIVAVCQKCTSLLGLEPDAMQMAAIRHACAEIVAVIATYQQPIQFTLQLYARADQVRIFALQPFYIHCLSLFTMPQLLQNTLQQQPLIRVICKEEDRKQIDLTHYHTSRELSDLEARNQWLQFIKQSPF